MPDPAATIGSTVPGHYGAEATGLTVAGITIAAAWNLQGDPARPPFADAVRSALGVALPQSPNTIAATGALSAIWLGPASWLLVAGGDGTLSDFAARRNALNAGGGALFDLTSSRVAWSVRGQRAATVLATGCPLDFHPHAFPAGACAQSVLWNANALILKPGAAAEFAVMVPRSFAEDAWHALCRTAAQYGYDIASPAPFR